MPGPNELRRLESAVDTAALNELERILWLLAFAMIAFLDLFMVGRRATWPGLVGSAAGFFLLYARLRGVHLAGKVSKDNGMFSFGLRRREQRAFTALMFRSVLIGRNPLREQVQHDVSRWNQHAGVYLKPGEAPPEVEAAGDA